MKFISFIFYNMVSFVHQQAEELHLEVKDFELLYQTILEIGREGTIEEQKPYLARFEQEFLYVKTSPLYKSLYENFQFRYFPMLLNRIIWIEKQKQQRNYRNSKIEYYEYKKQSLYNRDVINRSKTFHKFR